MTPLHFDGNDVCHQSALSGPKERKKQVLP